MVHNARAFSSKTWVTIVVVGVLLLVVFAFAREYVRNIDIATELERMEAENDSLNAERLASLELISRLSTQTAVEEGARTKLNLAAEGETMYVVEDGGAEAAGSDIEVQPDAFAVAADPALSNPAKWFYYFFTPDSFEEPGAL